MPGPSGGMGQSSCWAPAPPSTGDTKHSGQKQNMSQLVCVWSTAALGCHRGVSAMAHPFPARVTGIAVHRESGSPPVRHKQHHLNAEFPMCLAVCVDCSGLGGSSRLPRWCWDAAPASMSLFPAGGGCSRSCRAHRWSQ